MNTPAPAPPAPAPLAVTVRLFAELEARGVRYCHWKSTPGLAIAMAGRTDLDLLVEREDAGIFAEVVRQLGFKPFISHPSRRFPAVDDLLGYDRETGRLVHLHVYYQLILGEHFVKNHRLPFERALIAASRPKDGVRIPPPELEVAILAYRTLLKYRDADATKDLLRAGHRGGIPREALAELRTLAATTSPDAVAAAMREHMPGLAPEPVIGLMEIVRDRPRDARALVRVRRQARLALRAFERSPARSAWWRYMRARVGAQWPVRLLTRSAGRRAVKRKSPQAGGLMVAIVGSDGAGKSTAVSHIVDWLAWRLNVSVAYLGSSQPSRGTAATKRVAKLARAVARRLPRSGAPEQAPGGIPGLLMALRHHGDAQDRARRARAAHGLASRGVLVLLDRYPLPNVTVRGRALDGPRIRDTLDASHGLIADLAAREERLYRDLPRPDHLIVLRVSPAVAKARRPEHAADDLTARAEAISALDAGDLPVTVIDADRPLDEVLATVRATIWRLL
jgi:thymidylate kinase